MSTRLEPADAVPSTAAVRGHPIHPMLVPFPIAFLVGAFVTDLVYLAGRAPFWAYCTFWLLLAGIFTALLAAVFGLADFLGDRRVRDLAVARLHAGGNLVVVVLSTWNCWQRADDPAASVAPLGVVLSGVVVVLLLGTGWLGGELAYRHRVGVIARE
jgi:uncharacterized membrane protein